MLFRLGGEISDDPEAPRDETERLRYPRLKLLRELDEHQQAIADLYSGNVELATVSAPAAT